MTRFIFVVLLLTVGCTSQREKEAEQIYMDALSLEARGSNDEWITANRMLIKVSNDYADTKYAKLAEGHLQAMGPQVLERLRQQRAQLSADQLNRTIESKMAH